MKKIKNSIVFLYIKRISVTIFPILLCFVPVDSFNEEHTICLFTNVFGVNCFGCGITRAVIYAVQLDFQKAFDFNKLVVIVLPLLIFVWFKTMIQIYQKPQQIA